MAVLDLRQLAQEAEQKSSPVESKEEQLVKRSVTFNVEYHDPDTGKVLEGQFTAQVLNADGKTKVGRILSNLAGRTKFDDMPDAWKAWADAVANCAVRLTDKPSWFDTKAGEDDQLLWAVYGRLLEHEQAFFRSNHAAGNGETEQPSVVIR
jgi:hypothetical protein